MTLNASVGKPEVCSTQRNGLSAKSRQYDRRARPSRRRPTMPALYPAPIRPGLALVHRRFANAGFQAGRKTRFQMRQDPGRSAPRACPCHRDCLQQGVECSRRGCAASGLRQGNPCPTPPEEQQRWIHQKSVALQFRGPRRGPDRGSNPTLSNQPGQRRNSSKAVIRGSPYDRSNLSGRRHLNRYFLQWQRRWCATLDDEFQEGFRLAGERHHL